MEDILENLWSGFCKLLKDKMLLVKDADEYIDLSQIITCWLNIVLYKTNQNFQVKYYIHQVFNA